MNFFTKSETKSVALILFCLFVAIAVNMSISLRRGRDSTRKNDISAIQKELDTYYQKYRIYPLSNSQGEIVGCFDSEPVRDKSTGFPLNVVACKYGHSSFENIKTMPSDPNSKKGSSYLYISDGTKYEFYISLEGRDEAEYTQSIAAKNLRCGTEICNYGRGIDF